MKEYYTRMGDGYKIRMTGDQIREEIHAGVTDAAKRGKIPPLTEEEMDHLFNIITMDGIIVGVRDGEQVVASTDQGSDTVGAECGVPIDRIIQTQMYERAFGIDSTDYGFTDYNFKAVKSIASYEAASLEKALEGSVIPVLYGGMPNLGFYTKPDGPVDNWAELLPGGKIQEALTAQEEAIKYAVHDMVYVADQMYEAGADGINLDTCGAAGDADFLASLLACEEIRKNHPDMGVEIGMAGEFVLGMHGKLKYDDVRLAGLYPHKQVGLAEKAGATVFGAVVNTNTSMSFPWNIARVCTFIKETVKAAGKIAVHVNVGMGVGGIPMCEVIPGDTVSRADKALIEICKIDGLQIGEGDPIGTEITHSVSACMGGIKTAGDMVFRMQLMYGMRINEAKEYVAKKLGVSTFDLCDPLVMSELREDLGLGVQMPGVGTPMGIAAKMRMAEKLGIKINSVEAFKRKAGLAE